MFKHKLILLIAFGLSMSRLSSQKEMAQWRFGWRAGMDFLSSPPAVVGGSTHCTESSATISDSLGNLLFYVQESGVAYNKFNDTMALLNNYLNGGFQSGWIVPKSGYEYYVLMHNGMNFLQPWPYPSMTSYAVIDMSLAAGLGSVVVPSQSISAAGLPLVSKMAVTKHCNGKDYWILRHGGGWPGNNLYFAYLLSNTGISTTPVITAIGAVQPQGDFLGGYIYRGMHKFSPNGRKVAATMPNRTVELYDFNTATGQLSNMIRLDSAAVPASTNIPLEQSAKGLEFSPDGTKLYVSYINKHPHLCQFDLSLGTEAAIKASKTIIDPDTITSSVWGHAPQLAYGGKMYVIGSSSLHIGLINNPNSTSTLCAYNPSAVVVGTTATAPYFAYLGSNLPNCISNYFEQKPGIYDITMGMYCGTKQFLTSSLSAFAGYSVSAYYWNFNDPLSAANTSTLSQPTHSFSANGTYTVKLALNYYPCGTDTLTQVVTITDLPNPGLSGKTTLCKGEATTLSFTGGSTYTLNTTALPQNTAQIQPTITTVYTLAVKDNSTGCSAKKVFTITVLPCTGISETGLSIGLKVYPNPNSGVFTFETPEACEIKIHNSLGLEVYRASVSEGTSLIDISKEAKGIYLLEWRGKSIRSQIKIILE